MFRKPALFSIILIFALISAIDAPLAKSKNYYLKTNPIPVTNYLAGPNSFIVQSYLRLPSKQALKQVCPWMPRIQDAFMSALNTYNTRPRLNKPATEKDIEQVLTQTLRQAFPLKLPLGVKAFSLNLHKSQQQERKLQVKLKCK